MQLLHDDVVLEIWVPSEVEANPVAKFVILERFDLQKAAGKRKPQFCCMAIKIVKPGRTSTQ